MYERYISNMLESGKVGNALLFAGPAGSGKRDAAYKLSKKLADTLDIHIYRPQGKGAMHSISSMRELANEAYLVPNQSKHKVFLIEDADRMLKYSANALLKTFEEPPLDTLIILISNKPHRLLPTILSRCRTVHFAPVAKQHQANTFLANAPYVDYELFLEKLNQLCDQFESKKKGLEEGEGTLLFLNEVEQFLKEILYWVRDRDGYDKLSKAEVAVREARDAIERYSRLSTTLEALFLRVGVV